MTWNQLVIRASHLNVIIQQRIDKVNNDRWWVIKGKYEFSLKWKVPKASKTYEQWKRALENYCWSTSLVKCNSKTESKKYACFVSKIIMLF